MNALREKEFSVRFARYESELRWLYMQLYHSDGNAWRYFVSMLRRMYEARPDFLLERDRFHESNPDWYRRRNLNGVQLYVKRFAGNLKGLEDKLSYFEEAGITCLTLMPMLESPAGHSDGGFAVSNHRKINEDLGTTEDLIHLSQTCHDRNILLCTDFSLNHVSSEHEWARKARDGDVLMQERFFMYDTRDIPNMFERTIPQAFPTSAPGNFTWCPECRKVVMTTFYSYQWDLNYRNPAVFNDMVENMLFLVNLGIDIIRLGTLPCIWKELGTSCRNLPQVHIITRILRMITEIVCPGVLLLGEVVSSPEEAVPYFGTASKPECQMLYNATVMSTIWNTIATKDVRLLRHELETMFSLPYETLFVNYLRSNDDIGWTLDYDYLASLGQGEVAHKMFLNSFMTGQFTGSFARGELYQPDAVRQEARVCGTSASLCGIEAAQKANDAEALAKAVALDQMLHALILTFSGVPTLYSGDEIGMLNDYSYHEDPVKSSDSRYLHRSDFDWEKAALRSDPESIEGKLFTNYKDLLRIRSEHHVFDSDSDSWVFDTGNDSVLGIGRYLYGENVNALFNFTDEPVVIELPRNETCRDLLSGEYINLAQITLPPYGFRWLQATYYEF